jgi:hypothetical protein
MIRNYFLIFSAILSLLTVAAPAAAAGIDFNVTAGLDLAGSFDLGDISSSGDPGFTLGLEVMFDVPVVELGGGLEYGFPRGTGVAAVDAKYLQLYGIARWFIFTRFYLVGRLSYYDLSTDDIVVDDIGGSGALGLGAGLAVLKKLKVELIFNNITSSLDYDTWSARAVYTF